MKLLVILALLLVSEAAYSRSCISWISDKEDVVCETDEDHSHVSSAHSSYGIKTITFITACSFDYTILVKGEEHERTAKKSASDTFSVGGLMRLEYIGQFFHSEYWTGDNDVEDRASKKINAEYNRLSAKRCSQVANVR